MRSLPKPVEEPPQEKARPHKAAPYQARPPPLTAEVEESKILRYLQEAGNPQEAARCILWLGTEVRVAVRARLEVSFAASWRTLRVDAGYARDLAWGATEKEALERHRSRLRSWNHALRDGRDIHVEDKERQIGVRPTLNRATSELRACFLWEWSELDHRMVKPEVDMVQCRLAGIPLKRRV